MSFRTRLEALPACLPAEGDDHDDRDGDQRRDVAEDDLLAARKRREKQLRSHGPDPLE